MWDTGYWILGTKPENRIPKPELAFTLIELLLSVAIFSVVSIAVYATFNSGMSVWRRAEKLDAGKIKTLIKIEKMGKEIRQAVFLQRVPKSLWGDTHTLYFFTVNNSEVNRVTYTFDEGKKTLLKSNDALTDIIAAFKKKEETHSAAIPYLHGITSLSISYFYFDIQKGIYVWKEEWPGNGIPLAVKFNITIVNEPFTTTIFIPSA